MKNKDVIQEEALQALLPHYRAGVNISMGVGKTLIGLQHMNKNYTDYCKFLVVAPKKAIIQSWKDEAVKHNYEHLLPHITFTTYLSLDKQAEDYDILYADECHNLLFSHDDWLSSFQGKIVGLTGTAPKFKTSEKGKMVEQYCPIVYSYDTDDAVSDEILNEYEIHVHMLPLNSAKTILISHAGKEWYTSEQNVYDYWSKRIDDAQGAKSLQIARIQRMKKMMEFTSKEALAISLSGQIKDKCLIFANTMEQADRLCQHRYHSNNALSETSLSEFKEGKINKLSCVLQLSEGVNIPHLKQSIILHAYGNERKAAQRIGRTLRLNPNEKAIINILCYKETIDVRWVQDALANFDQNKIKYF
jgi:superfamily II DNA or RNA helicase